MAQISLGREETFNVYLAIKRLVQVKNLKSARFFGKFFGLQKDYIIVESERRDDERSDEDGENGDGEGEKKEEDPATKVSIGDIPKENAGAGVNRYVYWVCNQRTLK